MKSKIISERKAHTRALARWVTRLVRLPSFSSFKCVVDRSANHYALVTFGLSYLFVGDVAQAVDRFSGTPREVAEASQPPQVGNACPVYQPNSEDGIKATGVDVLNLGLPPAQVCPKCHALLKTIPPTTTQPAASGTEDKHDRRSVWAHRGLRIWDETWWAFAILGLVVLWGKVFLPWRERVYVDKCLKSSLPAERPSAPTVSQEAPNPQTEAPEPLGAAPCSAPQFAASILLRVIVVASTAIERASSLGIVPKWLWLSGHRMKDAVLLRLGWLQPHDLPSLNPVLSGGAIRNPLGYQTGTCTDRFVKRWLVFEQAVLQGQEDYRPQMKYLRLEGRPLLARIWIRLFSLSVYSENSSAERKAHTRALARWVTRLVGFFIEFLRGLLPTSIQIRVRSWRDRRLLASLENAYQQTTSGVLPLRGEFGLDQGWEPLPSDSLRNLHHLGGHRYPKKLEKSRRRFDRLLRVAKERGILKTPSA